MPTVNANPGENITLSCNVSASKVGGQHRPVYWTKKQHGSSKVTLLTTQAPYGRPVHEPTKPAQISFGPGCLDLYIVNVTTPDEGVYSCVARMDDDKLTTNTELLVLGE